MNKERRKRLGGALALLDQMQALFDELLTVVEEVRSDETDALDGLPESFREGDQGWRMQEAIDNLDQVAMEDAFDEVRGLLEAAMR